MAAQSDQIMSESGVLSKSLFSEAERKLFREITISICNFKLFEINYGHSFFSETKSIKYKFKKSKIIDRYISKTLQKWMRKVGGKKELQDKLNSEKSIYDRLQL